MKKVIIIFLTGCFFLQNGICQKYEFGIKAGLYDYYYFGDGTVGNWYLESTNSVVFGKSLSTYFRFNYHYLFIESQIAFSYNNSELYLTNLTPERNYEGEHVFSTIAGIDQMHFSIPIKSGLQLVYRKFKFKSFIGVTPAILLKTDNSDIYTRAWDEISRCIYKSYKPIIINGSWGIELSYNRFSLEIKRENNLTPIIKIINYEGATYDYNLSTKRLYLIFGFNFYPWKPKKINKQ